MMRSTCLGLVMAAALTTACSVVIEDDGASHDDDGAAADDGDVSGGPHFEGKSCKALAGERTLPSWMGDQGDDVYPRSLFSFALNSTDIDVVHNDGDILYTYNMLAVQTVVDDVSFIVDLGDVALDEVPATVRPDDYPNGNWEEHDYVQAVLGHTYLVRTADEDTEQWAAFRVVGLAPADKVTFEWILSTETDRMVVPTPCL